jgi:choline dehydrogenase
MPTKTQLKTTMSSRIYDHIVVGGGNAGAVIAARLSEISDLNVLLVEAGPHYRSVAKTPHDLKFAFTVSVQDHDWGYVGDAVPGRPMAYARGKATGGCSAVNGVIALRGLEQDFVDWVREGNDQWSWERLLPYFIRIENDQDFGSAPHHGLNGPLPIVRFKHPELFSVQKAFLEACHANGYGWVPDHNDPRGFDGVGPIPMNRRGDVRVSSAMAYLHPAQDRKNLTIMDKTTVLRVLFEGKRAVGVEVRRADGRVQQIKGGGVVLSGGTINDVAILWRSGVGPRDELQRLGVPLVQELQGVGSNLMDHSQSLVALIPKPGVLSGDIPDVQLVVEYTAPGSRYKNDMQIYCVNKLGKERLPELSGPVDFLYAAMCVINRPDSRGRVTLTSLDPDVQPRIDFRLNTHGEDMRKLVDGVRRCWAIGHTGEFAGMSTGVAVLTPQIVEDDRKLEKYIWDNAATIWHAVGTCRMGPASDNQAVVDQHLCVHGIANLRVADGSVFPNHVSRNPMLTIYVVAERCAEFIARG